MPRKGRRKAKVAVGDPNDPEGLLVWMNRFLEALRVKNYSPFTIENRESYLRQFIGWCDARSIGRPSEVTKPILERYQRYLYHFRRQNGRPLSFRSQHARLVPVRTYFKWLTRQNVLLWNPASELELPKLERRLPKHVLTAAEAERVLGQPNERDALGLRDRAILEVFYSTGIRRMELLNLTIYDLDTERGTLMVRQGKGKKDRMVPIGERAIAWIERYVNDARSTLVMPPDDGTLFLGVTGDELGPCRLSQLVRRYVDAAELGKRGACHLFRHTMATLMLENGADIRYIQEMLGHAVLSTTQVYTQVSIRRLKQVHTLTHPGAKVTDAAHVVAELDADDTDAGDVFSPIVERPSDSKSEVTAEELMARLAAEDDEEGDDASDDIASERVAVRKHGA